MTSDPQCPFESFLADQRRGSSLLIQSYIASQPTLAKVLTAVATVAYFAGRTDGVKDLLDKREEQVQS